MALGGGWWMANGGWARRGHMAAAVRWRSRFESFVSDRHCHITVLHLHPIPSPLLALFSFRCLRSVYTSTRLSVHPSNPHTLPVRQRLPVIACSVLVEPVGPAPSLSSVQYPIADEISVAADLFPP